MGFFFFFHIVATVFFFVCVFFFCFVLFCFACLLFLFVCFSVASIKETDTTSFMVCVHRIHAIIADYISYKIHIPFFFSPIFIPPSSATGPPNEKSTSFVAAAGLLRIPDRSFFLLGVD